MSSYAGVFAASAVGIVVLMGVTWLVSLRRRDVSIVDPVWGVGFALVAVISRVVADGVPARQNLLTLLAVVWGLRLAVHLTVRHAGHGEDFRYAAMRRRHGDRFGVVSLYTVFALQGVLMFVVSLPLQVGQVPDAPGLGPLAYVGAALWLVGMAFEAIGDWQLRRFKADPANATAVLDSGLWRYTRHPNYFGDACVWWGIFLVAAQTGIGWVTIVSPILMTVLLVRVSGVPLLERSLRRRRPGYDDYIRRTSAFVPLPPKAR